MVQTAISHQESPGLVATVLIILWGTAGATVQTTLCEGTFNNRFLIFKLKLPLRFE